jgi:hypothetical protein
MGGETGPFPRPNLIRFDVAVRLSSPPFYRLFGRRTDPAMLATAVISSLPRGNKSARVNVLGEREDTRKIRNTGQRPRIGPNCNRRLDYPVLDTSTRYPFWGDRTDEEDASERSCKKAPAERRFTLRTVRRNESRGLGSYCNEQGGRAPKNRSAQGSPVGAGIEEWFCGLAREPLRAGQIA